MSIELCCVMYGNYGVVWLILVFDKFGMYMGMLKFLKVVKGELNLLVQCKNMCNVIMMICNKCVMCVFEFLDWQDLCDVVEFIKNCVGCYFDYYFVEVEKNLIVNGVYVYWVWDGEEVNCIVVQIVKDKGVDEVVKIKLIISQEIDFNEYFEE